MPPLKFHYIMENAIFFIKPKEGYRIIGVKGFVNREIIKGVNASVSSNGETAFFDLKDKDFHESVKVGAELQIKSIKDGLIEWS